LNRPTIAAKGVSKSGRVKHTRLSRIPTSYDDARRALYRLQRHLGLVRSLREFEAAQFAGGAEL
jgi:hypothetical protein